MKGTYLALRTARIKESTHSGWYRAKERILERRKMISFNSCKVRKQNAYNY
jgi:hypothetical protein